VLTSVVFVPQPPVLVPELAGAAAPETAALRRAVVAAAGRLGARWTALGAHRCDVVIGAGVVGSFGGFGRDVRVALGPASDGGVDRCLPLAALVAGWVRGRCAARASVTARLVAEDTHPPRCTELGATVRASLDMDDAPHGLLVLGDGATTLTAAAPGAFDDRAQQLQEDIVTALGSADVAALAALDPALCAQLGVGGRVPWQVAAAAVGAGWRGRLVHHSAPYGVGYTVAVWER